MVAIQGMADKLPALTGNGGKFVMINAGGTAMEALALTTAGAILIGDGATTPTTLAAFTSATGTLKHEYGGVEADISAIADGGILVGTGAGTMAVRASALTAGAAGFLKHELGGIEADISAIADGGMLVGTGAGTMAIRASALTAGAAGFIKHELGGLEFDASAVGDGDVPVGTGVGTMGLESGATLRTTLGLGTGNSPQFTALTLSGLTSGRVPLVTTSGLITDSGTFTYTDSSSNRNINVIASASTAATIGVQNTHASGLADITVIADGTGDAYSLFYVSGATYWSAGIDNSDSDAYVISQASTLGTNNALRISTAGEITQPLQPSFAAFLSSSQANKTGTGTNYTIVCDTEISDRGGDYNAGTGVFTAPVTGQYTFSAAAYMYGATVATNGRIFLSTSNRVWEIGSIYRAAGASEMVVNGTVVTADMDVGDTAYIYVNSFGEAGDTVGVLGAANPVTFFTGSLLN